MGDGVGLQVLLCSGLISGDLSCFAPVLEDFFLMCLVLLVCCISMLLIALVACLAAAV